MAYFNSSNSKMAKLSKRHALLKPIKTFGMTAIKSCPQADACKHGFDTNSKKEYHCFATQGPYRWPVVEAAYERRFKHSQSTQFVDDMVGELRRCKTTHVRLHDSGDFYNEKYLYKWINVMRDNPEIKFWCYTKSVRMFKQLEQCGIMPLNFHYVFSYGGKEDHLIDQDTDRYSKTVAPEDAKWHDLAGYEDATEDELRLLNKNQRAFYTVAH